MIYLLLYLLVGEGGGLHAEYTGVTLKLDTEQACEAKAEELMKLSVDLYARCSDKERP